MRKAGKGHKVNRYRPCVAQHKPLLGAIATGAGQSRADTSASSHGPQSKPCCSRGLDPLSSKHHNSQTLVSPYYNRGIIAMRVIPLSFAREAGYSQLRTVTTKLGPQSGCASKTCWLLARDVFHADDRSVPQVWIPGKASQVVFPPTMKECTE